MTVFDLSPFPGAPFNIDMLDVNKFLKRMDGIFLSVYLLEFLLKVVLKVLLISNLSLVLR